MPSFALEVQRGSIPGAPNATEFSGGFISECFAKLSGTSSTVIRDGFGIFRIDLPHDLAQVGVPSCHEGVGRFSGQRRFVGADPVQHDAPRIAVLDLVTYKMKD